MPASKTPRRPRAPTPTHQTYRELQLAFDHLNRTIFDGELPACLITLQRKGKHILGYYSAGRFANRRGARTDEIAMNPRHFQHRKVLETISTLAHEMVHQWQQHFGTPSRRGYHNRQWAARMVDVGLHPSHTGELGGRMTGQQMTHYIIEGGAFEIAAKQLLRRRFGISWFDVDAVLLLGAPRSPGALEPSSTAGRRVKFTCPSCQVNAWGKSSLRILCIDCKEPMRARQQSED